MRIHVDQAKQKRGIRGAVHVEPVVDFKSKAHRVNVDGLPMWDVHCTYLDVEQQRPRPENLKIRVPSVQAPRVEEGILPVQFGLLWADTYDVEGKLILSWSSDEVTLGDTARRKPPAPSTDSRIA